MKMPGRSSLLKLLAVTSLYACFCSVAVTVRAYLCGTAGGPFANLLTVVFFLLGHLAGRFFIAGKPLFVSRAASLRPVGFLSFMLHIRNGARSLAVAAAWLVPSPVFLALLLVYRQNGLRRNLFEILVAVVAYGLALKQSGLNYSDVLSRKIVWASIILLGGSLEASLFLKPLAYLRPWLFATAYYFLFSYMILQNQDDINENIFSKKHIEKSILPRNLRRFNMLSVCVLFLVILLLFNLKPIVVYLLRVIGKLALLLAQFFLWIISQIFPLQEHAQQKHSAMQNFGMGTGPVDPLRNLLGNIVKNFVLLYVAYRLVLAALRRLPGLVRRIHELLRRLFSIQRDKSISENSDYSDVTETVRPVRGQERRVKKLVRRNRRSLAGISDPVERIRYMYASLLGLLPSVNIQHTSSDTTLEILGKTARRPDISGELSPFTDTYNQVRYGGEIPDGSELQKAQQHYGRACEAIRRGKEKRI